MIVTVVELTMTQANTHKKRTRSASSNYEEASPMDGVQDTEQHGSGLELPSARLRFGGAGSFFILMGLAVALHGALFSALDVIAPLGVDEPKEVFLVIDTPVEVFHFVADAR